MCIRDSPYTVQTALTAFGYYNVFTHGWSPSIVLEKSKQMAVEAFDETVELSLIHI